MSREWVLEVKADPSDPQRVVISLGLKEAPTGRVLQMTPACRSMQAFTREVSAMKSELDEALNQAQKRLEEARSGGVGGEELAPETAWKAMQSLATEAEMFNYFNSMNETDRQRVAEHIFTHANMFKGRGPVFSEHFDHSSHKLE